MTGNNYLLDTNAILYILGGDKELTELLHGEHLAASIITYMELLSFPGITPGEIHSIQAFLEEFDIIPLNETIRDRAIDVRRSSKLKLPDSIIAATALVINQPVITADKAFERIPELNLVLLER